MKIEEMPVIVLFTRRCRCGTVSRATTLYARCPNCDSKDGFRAFECEGMAAAWKRAKRLATMPPRPETPVRQGSCA